MPKIKYIPRSPDTSVNVSKTSPIKSYFILSFGITAACLGLYLLLGIGISLLVPHLPVSLENKLGGMYGSLGEVGKDQEASDRLQDMLDAMIPFLDKQDRQRQYRVVVTENPMVNALALPGGKIVVFSGLLDEMPDDRQVAFVLGHELGHFHNRDHLRQMGRGLAGMLVAVTLFGTDSGISDFIFQQMQNVESKFSQDQEQDADLFGLELIRKCYGDTRGAVEFMEAIAEKETHGQLAYYFATHPHPKLRVDFLKEQIQKLK